MKKLPMISLVLGLLLAGLALYVQFVAAPHEDAIYQRQHEGGTYNSSLAAEWMDAHDQVSNFSMIALLGGGVLLLISVFAFMKTKDKMAIGGIVLSLVATLIGLIHGTHMFD